MPHLPQLAVSVDSSTHAEPHVVSPTAHADSHAPLEHTSPAAHECPHDPQLVGSLDVSVQAPEHDVSFAGHAIDGGNPHSPPTHWYPVPQSALVVHWAVSPPQHRSTSRAATCTRAAYDQQRFRESISCMVPHRLTWASAWAHPRTEASVDSGVTALFRCVPRAKNLEAPKRAPDVARGRGRGSSCREEP